jgi:hypothetical protein
MAKGRDAQSGRIDVASRLSRLPKHVVVFDLETTRIPEDRDLSRVKVKCSCAYSSYRRRYFRFEAHQTSSLIRLLKSADRIVGFNSNEFDLKVLRNYGLPVPLIRKSFDLMQRIEARSGNRYALEDLAMEQDLDEYKSVFLALEDHCKNDVRLTKWLYELYLARKLKFDRKKWPIRRNPKKDTLQGYKLAKTFFAIQKSVYGKRFSSGRQFKEHLGKLAEDPDCWDDEDVIAHALQGHALSQLKVRRWKVPD